MPTLPAHPSLDNLRRQAKGLLRAAKAGDREAARAIHAVAEELTLAAAQLAVARGYGFASWTRLKAEVQARALDLAKKAEEFCVASVRDWTGRATRMLAESPEVAGHGIGPALVLGEEDRVRAALGRDPGLATRTDPRSGWTPLHLVCGSRWHFLDPERRDALVAVARLLLEAGAGVDARTEGRPGGRTPLGCATASASGGAGNEPLIALLLERGAIVEDSDLYLAGFARNAVPCLRLLLAAVPDVAAVARMALAAPISKNDPQGVRVLLEAGADPQRYADDNGQPASVVPAAISAGCGVDLIELLLAHGADPNALGPDGRSPYQLATARGRRDLAELLLSHGAQDDATETDRLLAACLRSDRAEVRRRLDENPELLDHPEAALVSALQLAAETGNPPAVGMMLDLGFPIDASVGDHGETALHAAAYSGSAGVVRLLLERGADVEARDSNWDSTALEWAAVGSGERPTTNPGPDWVSVVRLLLAAGASTAGITLSPDDPKRPSPEVAALLRDQAGAR